MLLKYLSERPSMLHRRYIEFDVDVSPVPNPPPPPPLLLIHHSTTTIKYKEPMLDDKRCKFFQIHSNALRPKTCLSSENVYNTCAEQAMCPVCQIVLGALLLCAATGLHYYFFLETHSSQITIYVRTNLILPCISSLVTISNVDCFKSNIFSSINH